MPSPDGPYAYNVRYREGGQHPILCRQPRDGGPRRVLLDCDALAAGKPFFQLGGTQHSPDHRLLAWSADEKGSEYDALRIRDLGTGADLADLDSGCLRLAGLDRRFIRLLLRAARRKTIVRRASIGTGSALRRRMTRSFTRSMDGRFFVSLGRLQSGRFADISVHDHETSESRLIDLTIPDAQPVLVAARTQSVQYDVEHHPAWAGEEVLLVRTNADGAEDFKLALTPLASTARENWRDLVPHRRGDLSAQHDAARGLAGAAGTRGQPAAHRRAAPRKTGEEHAIAFPEEAYSLGAESGYEFVTDRLRFHYSSMTTPNEVWDYDLKSRARTLRKRQEVPSGHDPAAYVTRRLQAKAPDGETVPVSILHRRDVKADGTAPLLLYGYGSYGYAMPASFNTSRLSLVDRGFVYAIAHVRGGTEKGWHWYQDGKLAKKANTFTDFIAAAEHLRRARLCGAGQDRRAWRLGGRLADGRDRQHAARTVRRHHRGGAVRRCNQHDDRRHRCR